MKPRLLFFAFLFACGLLQAQEAYKSLIITEARMDRNNTSYIELTNMGSTAVNLKDFEVGLVGPWTTRIDEADITKWFESPSNIMLPDRVLQPGETFLIASVFDYGPKAWAKDPTKGGRVLTKAEFWNIADLQIHHPEATYQPDPEDSVSAVYEFMVTWNGRDCFYLRHHISETDSVVVDQVNGIFDGPSGRNQDKAYDAAGMKNASNLATLVRKYSVKVGNLDYATARGVDITDSEWMPIPHLFANWEPHRKLFWTAGNHGDFNLNETTLTSDVVDISWADSTLTVPWGIRRDDSLMMVFDKKPGFAWHYHYSPKHYDSAYYTVRTGDKFTVYACGNDLDIVNFKIVVAPPAIGANIVIPKRIPVYKTGFFSADPPSWVVTDKVPGMDTIKEFGFSTRADTLLKYLEKAPKASWVIEWLGGVETPDIKAGDILKVTAENGDIKRYYLKPDKFQKSHNAYLSAITWPDIPDFYRGIYGWVGDTIPGFDQSVYDYMVTIPWDVDGIPSLLARTSDVNAKLETKKVNSLRGDAVARTITYNVTAEDDTSKKAYTVLLEKEKDQSNIQPWPGEPFLSEINFWDQYQNGFIEICNPGTVDLDLSNYMLYFWWSTDPGSAISNFDEATGYDFKQRYVKYIPGYKWQTREEWMVQPAIAVQDLLVNPIVAPGDVFVLGDIRTTSPSGYPWFASQACDIDFMHNPWNDTDSINETAARQWSGSNFYLFKIIGDSVRDGLKPATDPADFELIERWGNDAGSVWVPGGEEAQMITSWIRKPEFYSGKTGSAESWGTNAENSEWLKRDMAYYNALGVPYPNNWLYTAIDLGKHFMYDVTFFNSTVGSNIYVVSTGYSKTETIKGVAPGTTVNDFLANIIKADVNQKLVVFRNTGKRLDPSNDTLTGTEVLANGDILAVTSADAVNESNYILDLVTVLNNDAVLTSEAYTVTVTDTTGTISGFSYGTALKDVYNGILVPAGATMVISNSAGEYVPFVMLAFNDTAYNEVLVNSDIYFEVLAEDGITKIVYQLVPDMIENGAFITSAIFDVDQDNSSIDLVPRDITVYGMLKYLTPAPGATIKIVDKFGFERILGDMAFDDQIVVTAADGVHTKTYSIQVLPLKASNLAYVTSDVYNIIAATRKISGDIIAGVTTVEEFLSNLIPAPGAYLKVVDKLNQNDTLGIMQKGYKLWVQSENNQVIRIYTISVVTGVNEKNAGSVSVYPNPTHGNVFISGLAVGSRIQVTNMLGQCVLSKVALNTTEEIILAGQRQGVYLITVSDSKNTVGHFKVVLK